MKYPISISLFFLQFFTCCFCFAQTEKIDSLKRILPDLTDSAGIDCLNELGFEYSNPYWKLSHYVQTDTALFYTVRAEKDARQLNYIKGIGNALQNFGIIEEQRGNFITAEEYTSQAIHLLEKTDMQSEYHRAIVNLGWCYFNQGRYQESLHEYKKAIPYYENIGDSTHIAMIYRMTGNNYDWQGRTDSSFYFFQKNCNIKKRSDDINGIIHTTEFKGDMYLIAGDTAKAIFFYLQSADSAKAKIVVNNHDFPSMFLVYKLRHEYDSALLYFQQDIHSIQSTGTDSFLKKKDLMITDKDIAELYLLLNDYNKTITYCQQPLKAFKEGGNINEMMTVLKYLAMAYEGLHDDVNSLKYANQLLTYAKKSDAKPGLRDAYMILWNIYNRNHKLSLAYRYYLKYSELNDFIKSADYRAKIAAWEAISKITEEDENYTARLKLTEERNNARLALVRKQKELQLYIFLSVLATGLLLTAAFIRNAKLKRRKEKLQLLVHDANLQLEKQNREREVTQLQQQKTELEMQALRAQMNPHFIFNSLNSINMFILENNKLQASEYLSKFSRLVRLILQNSQEAFIPLERELEALQLYLELESLRFEQKFEYKIT